MFTYGQFKLAIRQRIWPFGEALELIPDHDGSFVDALIDLQSFVPCLKSNQTDIAPHCNTTYNCGLTVLDAPLDEIVSLSVVDRINATTHKEDSTAPIDWCSEIFYKQVDVCHVRAYLQGSNRRGCCLSIPFFFGIPSDLCAKARFPIPTDAGVPNSLPVLPLGFHYAQLSTDRKHGRAHAGVWAIERGKIWIAPWIQSTESVVIKWDGIKRIWGDDDPISDDPMLSNAVLEYLRWKNADKWDKDESEMVRAQAEYVRLRAMLIRQCRESTRVRECGGDAGGAGSQSRSSASSITQLFFNSEQKFTASCADGFTGNPVTETIPAGSVSSTISIADANQKAKDQAQAQAVARLDCTAQTVTYQSVAVTAHAACVQEQGAPQPDGDAVTVTLPAGAATSTISIADATAIAQALAQAMADSQLKCTFWNRAVTVNKTCVADGGITASVTIAAHTYSSTLSQADADAQATTAATNQANQSLTDQGCADNFFKNTEQFAIRSAICKYTAQNVHGQVQLVDCVTGEGTFPACCVITVKVTVPIDKFSSPISQADANQMALDAAESAAQTAANTLCTRSTCATYGCLNSNLGKGCTASYEFNYPVLLPL